MIDSRARADFKRGNNCPNDGQPSLLTSTPTEAQRQALFQL